jgi:hypothetical protein
MPEKLERCVSGLLEKWEKDPSSRPAPRENDQDAKAQAFAICTAAMQRDSKASLDIMLGDGAGPAIIGVAATNRPYIPGLKPIQVIKRGEGEEQEQYFFCHLARAGFYAHPLGPFTLDQQVFAAFDNNFKEGVVGQDVALDARHRPDLGALAWLKELSLSGDGANLYGWFKPTKKGLGVVEDGEYRYCSIEFRRNFSRDDVKIDMEQVTEDYCPVIELEQKVEGNDMGNDTVELEQLQAQLKEAQTSLQLEKDRAEAAQKAANEAKELALKLEQDALAVSIEGVLALGETYRDGEGKGHAKQVLDWARSVLAFEAFGDIKLSADDVPGLSVKRYMIGAVRNLLTTIPGTVPCERQTESGSGKEKTEYDFSAEWED